MTIKFDTSSDYFKFVFAKEFRFEEGGMVLKTPPSILERIGAICTAPIMSVSDKVLQNLNNPLLIIAVTIILIAAVSISFYPVATMKVIGTVAPIILKVTPEMSKFFLYVVVQITTLGIGLRAAGRMFNPRLVDLWNEKKLVPIQIGAVSI